MPSDVFTKGQTEKRESLSKKSTMKELDSPTPVPSIAYLYFESTINNGGLPLGTVPDSALHITLVKNIMPGFRDCSKELPRLWYAKDIWRNTGRF